MLTVPPTVTSDHLGRTVVVLPDDVAAHLREVGQRSWIEIADVNHGYSAAVPADSEDGCLIRTILDAVAEHATDQRDQHIATDGGSFYGFIVGESGWDAERRSWTDYQATRHLHVAGSIVRNYQHPRDWRFQG